MKIFGLNIFEPNPLTDQPITEHVEGESPQPKKSMDDYNILYPNTMPADVFSGMQVAKEVASIALNTQARQILGGFTFTQTGSLAVGNYVSGASGDIRISPNGIVGRNSSGVSTFTIDGTTGDATFMGTITALAGSIGGFTIASGYLYAGTGANTAGLSPADYPFWAGATYANRATAPFRVTPAGALTASNATITGTITANAGSIGGFTIESGYLYAGTGANTAGLSPADYPFWAGATYDNRATAPFRVTPAGTIVVTDIIVAVTSQAGGGSGADFQYSGASRVLINGSGALVRNTRGFFMEETVAGNYGSLFIGADNIMVLKAAETTDQIYIEDSAGNSYFKVLKQTMGGEEHAYVSMDSYLELLNRTNVQEPAAGKLTNGSMWYDSSDNEIHCMIGGARYRVDVTAL